MQTAILALSVFTCLLCLVTVVVSVLVLRALIKHNRNTQDAPTLPNTVPVTLTLPVTPALASAVAHPAPASTGPVIPPVPPVWVEEREKAYKGRQLEGVRVE